MAIDSLHGLQVPDSAPLPDGLSEATGLVLAPLPVEEHLAANFPPEVYDLSPGSHLSRFAKALLGEAGVGQVSKRMLVARLGATLAGTHFFDLDRFYGALFNLRRRVEERYDFDPHASVASAGDWDDVRAKDSAYRSRIEQFARALGNGPTAIGMELMAEALLGVDCDVRENYIKVDYGISTYSDLEDFTFGGLEAYSYGDLEGDPSDQNRWAFTIVPHRPITEEERYDLIRVLSRIKPANSILRVQLEGVATLVPITPRGAWSDSENWEFRRETPQSDAPPEPIVVPPFTNTQGAKWSYLWDVHSVLSYSENPPGHVVLDGVRNLDGSQPVGLRDQTLRFPDGTSFTYAARLALLRLPDAARSGDEGIALAHPYLGPRTTPSLSVSVGSDGAIADSSVPHRDIPPVPLHVDGLPATAVASLADRGSASDALWSQNNFWSTPEVDGRDGRLECWEVRLNDPKPINYYSFEVPHFPHVARLQYYDESAGAWVNLTRHRVMDSSPARLRRRVPAVVNGSWRHPQHGTNNHWVRVEGEFDAPVQARSFRVVMRRNVESGVGPVDGATPPVALAYSLGLRNFDFGLVVRSPEDVSQTTEVRLPSQSVLGESIDNVLVQFPAAQALEDVDGYWRSTPQPTNAAAVNFYLDVRSESGASQVIDRIYIDPIHPGAHLNLYYTDSQPPPGSFPAEFVELTAPRASGVGSYTTSTSNGIDFPDDEVSYIDIDNGYVQWDPMQGPWWAGISVLPSFDSSNVSTETGLGSLLDFGRIALSVSANQINVVFDPANFGDYESTLMAIGATLSFNAWQRVRIAVIWDPDSGMTVRAFRHGDDEVVAASIPISAFTPQAGASRTRSSTLRIGGALPATKAWIEAFFGIEIPDLIAGFRLRSFVLKQGMEAIDLSDVDSFLLSPSSYTKPPAYGGSAPALDNAVVFYNPALIHEGQVGFYGGPGQFYESIEWKAIPRDYTLQRGYLHLPPTNARFIKFEFTSLTSEPCQWAAPLTKPVKMLATPAVSSVGRPLEATPGVATAMALDPMYADALAAITLPPDPTNRSPIAAMYSPDPSVRDRMRKIGWQYRFQSIAQGSAAPALQTTAVHRYHETSVDSPEKLAFYVGLRSIQPYRLDYGANDDTAAYTERFWDAQGLVEPFTWSLSPGYISSADQPFAEVTSKVYGSESKVRGVQFATQQSDAVQLLRNDAFRDPGMIGSAFDDPADWHALGDASLRYDPDRAAVVVSRDYSGSYVPSGREGGVMYEPLQPTFHYESEAAPDPGDGFGGLASGLALVSAAGAIHAAVRVTALTEMSQDLVLSIVAADDTVVAQKVFSVRKGGTVEQTLSYTIGSFDGALVSTFAYRGLDHPLHPLLSSDPLDEVEGPPEGVGSLFRVALTQAGDSSDQFRVDRFSLFDEAITWEFSVDGGESFLPANAIRNNRNGVVSFPRPATQLVWRCRAYRADMHVTSLRIRPWYERPLSTGALYPARGANLSGFDQDPPIESDPEFNGWNNPVPRWWFLEGQRFPASAPMGAPALTEFATHHYRAITETVTVTDDAVAAVSMERAVTEDGGDMDTFAVRVGEGFSRVAEEDAESESSASATVLPPDGPIIAPFIHTPFD